jgi:hypothetical protein
MSGDGCYGLRARLMNRLLHLIYDPIPVSDGLHRDGAAIRQASQECPVRFSIMIHSHCQFPVSASSTATNSEYFLCASQPIKCLMLQHLPWFLPSVGYGTHQSALQRFHPIKLGVNPLDVKAAMALLG